MAVDLRGKSEELTLSTNRILDAIGKRETLRQDKANISRFLSRQIELEGQGIDPELASRQAALEISQEGPQFDTGIKGGFQKLGSRLAGPSTTLTAPIAGQLLDQPQGLNAEKVKAAIMQSRASTAASLATTQKKLSPDAETQVSVITDPDNPDRAIRVRDRFDPATGERVGRVVIGEATLADKLGGVAAEALQKATTGKIERDVIDLQATIQELDQIQSEFDPSFFTFRGKASTKVTAFLEKAEVPIASDAKQFLRKKTKFFADSKRVFLKFRKFITGVAGGIEEFREIAKATIDPESDSPTEFDAKFTSMRDNAVRVSNLLLAIKNSGFDPENRLDVKSALQKFPLESIPLDIAADVTLDTLGQTQTESQEETFTPDQIEAELRRRGVQ